ncbi:hypothetical protein NEOLEDRAFT_1055097, partial [Neolentinus lepideus HHB14362 ss-1]
DGGDHTVISYFAEVSDLVCMGGTIATDLGMALPLKFTGRARRWWLAEAESARVFMSLSWTNLAWAIRHSFLGPQWMEARRNEFESMRFRQSGHSSERPIAYIQRRIMYARMVLELQGEDLSPTTFMQNGPAEWNAILQVQFCASTHDLMLRARTSEQALLSFY